METHRCRHSSHAASLCLVVICVVLHVRMHGLIVFEKMKIDMS
jgi:hypothetical protein